MLDLPDIAVGSDAARSADAVGFNLAVRHRPACLVRATEPQHVAAAVRHAAERRLAIAVQATGHGAVMPADGAMLISTRALREVTVDPVARTARIDAGAVWSEVVAATARHGLAPLNGSAATVGAIGYLTGGGLGPLSRAHGLAVDHVRWMDLVTPDGEARRVDPDHDAELFWAVRGGKSNFGIVTRAEIGLLPVARIYGGGLYVAGDAVADVLHAYRAWVPTLGPEAHVAIALRRLRPAPGIPDALTHGLVGHLRITHLGSAAEAERDLAAMRAIAPVVLDTVREMPYADVASIHDEPREPMPSWGRGALLRELPAAAVDALVAAAGPDSGSPLGVVELRPLGGAIAREPRWPSAVDGRDAAFSLNVLGRLTPETETAVPEVGERILAALSPWRTGGSFINFQGAATAPHEVAAAWTPATYARLARLKREVDPHHLLRIGHVIEPAAA